MLKKKEKLSILAAALLMIFAVAPVSNAMHVMEGFLPVTHCVLWIVICIPFLVIGVLNIKKLLDDQLPDHRFLNDEVENPTAENLAQYLFKKAGEKLAEKGLKLKTLEIWESANAAAIMEG